MHIVIDISEENFTCLKDAFESDDWMQQKFAERESAELLFREGTILREHGRLIDADAYRRAMLNSREFDFFKTLNMQPTIIEADKEASK